MGEVLGEFLGSWGRRAWWRESDEQIEEKKKKKGDRGSKGETDIVGELRVAKRKKNLLISGVSEEHFGYGFFAPFLFSLPHRHRF